MPEKKRGAYGRVAHGGELGINLTPMIDCTFQLIIFFILTTQFAKQALSELTLPEPKASQVKPDTEGRLPDRVIVNVLSVASGKKERSAEESWEGKRYEIDGSHIQLGDEETLIRIFKKRRVEAAEFGVLPKDFSVEIRADKDVNFVCVEPVMMAAAVAEIRKIKLTARRGRRIE